MRKRCETILKAVCEHNLIVERHSVLLICLSLVCRVVLARSQKCQTARTAFLCLSPWLGWHSDCGTDGRQLHLSGFLCLLFGNQWLHYRRPVQLHSLAVSRAVCSVCLLVSHSLGLYLIGFWQTSSSVYISLHILLYPASYFSSNSGCSAVDHICLYTIMTLRAPIRWW